MYSGGVWDHAKADLVFDLVKAMKQNRSSSLSTNLDCLCMETHLQPTVPANSTGYAWLRTNFDRYKAIGVDVHLNAITISVDGFDAQFSSENFNEGKRPTPKFDDHVQHRVQKRPRRLQGGGER